MTLKSVFKRKNVLVRVISLLLIFSAFHVAFTHIFSPPSNEGDALQYTGLDDQDDEAEAIGRNWSLLMQSNRTSFENSRIVFQDEKIPPETNGQANATLGFTKIIYINLPTRYDRGDAIAMQSAMTGIKFEEIPAVTADDIRKNDIGLPPALGPYRMKAGEKACFRSHANTWRKMISEGWDTMLVLEADASWEMSLRESFFHMSHGIHSILKEMRVLSSNGEGPTEDDPYMSRHWDFLQLGGCFSQPFRKELSLQYYDPYAPKKRGLKFHGKTVKSGRRVIRFRGNEACTVGYAVSRAGALKLLLRTAVDMSLPVDMVITSMIEAGRLRSFSVFPNMFDQWVYDPKLGMQAQNSDLRGGREGARSSKVSKDAQKKFHEKMSIWQYRFPEMSAFSNGVLQNMKKKLFEKQKLA